MSFELPETMSQDVNVYSAIEGIFIQFSDGERGLGVPIPQRRFDSIFSWVIEIPGDSRSVLPRQLMELAK